jgi:hypothetical protein
MKADHKNQIAMRITPSRVVAGNRAHLGRAFAYGA